MDQLSGIIPKKLKLSDYAQGVTLGTGIFINLISNLRFLWSC